MKNWLILADDLTGAADCAIAFSRQGADATVGWKNAYPKVDERTQIFSYNADSRELSADESANLEQSVLEKLWSPQAFLFCKIDSTLRGQPAAIITATIDFLTKKTGRGIGILAPAFPATGRVTKGGRVFVNNSELEKTELWHRDHTYQTSDMKKIIEDTGLKAIVIGVDELRQGGNEFARLIEKYEKENEKLVLIFDAEAEEDLQKIANFFAKANSSHFFIGSAGLAHAFAARCPVKPRKDIGTLQLKGGIMIVVGSLAEASRQAAKKLLATRMIEHFPISPEVLLEDSGPLKAIARNIVRTLNEGGDVLVEITMGDHIDMSLGSQLAKKLACSLQETGNYLAGFAATGGETATYLMEALGINGITLEDEIEAGVSLGITWGKTRAPVATKAGAFGDENSLVKIFDRLTAIRNEGKLS